MVDTKIPIPLLTTLTKEDVVPGGTQIEMQTQM